MNRTNTHDTASITTVKEYKFKPSERLPAVKGTAAYKPLQNNTVRFALNVWAGNAVARTLYRTLGYEERAITMNKQL